MAASQNPPPGAGQRDPGPAVTDAPGQARRRANQAQPTDPPGATRPAAAARRPGRASRAEGGATGSAAAGRRAGRASRSGRRGGDSGTREAILAAARARFGDLGYDRATIRGIAADAGVDAALVHHFYGTKDRLFAAAMRLPVNPREVLAEALAPGSRGQQQSLGEHLLRTVLGVWEVAEIRSTFLGLLRSAPTSEQAVVMLREFLAGAILGPLTAAASQAAPGAGGKDPGYRAALVASQVLGLGLTRYVLEVEPLAQASSEELIAAIAPNLDRYLSGDLG
jgi:AcrR family transcriptional regulator